MSKLNLNISIYVNSPVRSYNIKNFLFYSPLFFISNTITSLFFSLYRVLSFKAFYENRQLKGNSIPIRFLQWIKDLVSPIAIALITFNWWIIQISHIIYPSQRLDQIFYTAFQYWNRKSDQYLITVYKKEYTENPEQPGQNKILNIDQVDKNTILKDITDHQSLQINMKNATIHIQNDGENGSFSYIASENSLYPGYILYEGPLLRQNGGFDPLFEQLITPSEPLPALPLAEQKNEVEKEIFIPLGQISSWDEIVTLIKQGNSFIILCERSHLIFKQDENNIWTFSEQALDDNLFSERSPWKGSVFKPNTDEPHFELFNCLDTLRK